MLLGGGPAKLERLAWVREHFLPPLGFVVFYSDPSPKHRDGSRECLAGELKMLSLLLVDLMNGPRNLKAPSALAGRLPSFLTHLLDKYIGELWVLCLLLFLLEKLVPSHCCVLITQDTKEVEHQLVTLYLGRCTWHAFLLRFVALLQIYKPRPRKVK